MSSFGLPIGANGLPPIGGTGGGFGQPSGVSIGPASGGFGGVSQTHPGNTFQQTVGPRNNVRFQVQPQVTVACKPGFPLPDETKRKDYLMGIYMPRDGDYLVNRRFNFVGQAVAGLQQINEALYYLASGKGFETDLSKVLKLIAQNESGSSNWENIIRNPHAMYKFIKPFGVYNNRGTHDGQTGFESITNSNVGNIIGVNVSNYCFMRDIFGTDIRTGDLLELWYGTIKIDGKKCVQILPVAGCTESLQDTKEFKTVNPKDSKLPIWFRSNYGQDKGSIYYKYYEQLTSDGIVRVPIGRLWATPLHHPFQSTGGLTNIVGHDAGSSIEDQEDRVSFGGIGTKASMVYKNIEVELSPCRIHDCV